MFYIFKEQDKIAAEEEKEEVETIRGLKILKQLLSDPVQKRLLVLEP